MILTLIRVFGIIFPFFLELVLKKDPVTGRKRKQPQKHPFLTKLLVGLGCVSFLLCIYLTNQIWLMSNENTRLKKRENDGRPVSAGPPQPEDPKEPPTAMDNTRETPNSSSFDPERIMKDQPTGAGGSTDAPNRMIRLKRKLSPSMASQDHDQHHKTLDELRDGDALKSHTGN